LNYSQRISETTLFLLAIFFLFFLSTIYFHAKPTGDDLELILLFKENGFLNTLQFNFSQFNFRHVPLIIFYLLYLAKMSAIAQLVLFSLVTFLLIYGLKGIVFFPLQNKLKKPAAKIINYFIPVILLASIYSFTFASVEIFTSPIILLYYLMPVATALAGFSILFKKNKNRLHNCAMVLLFFSAGSGAENVSLLLWILFVLFFYELKTKNRLSIQNKFNYIIIYALLPFAFSSLLVYIAPGSLNRIHIEHEALHISKNIPLENPIITITNQLADCFYQAKSLLSASWLIFWFIIGLLFPFSIIPENLKLFNRIGLVVILLSFILSTFLSVYVFKGSAPIRIWFVTNIATCCFLSINSFLLGTRASHKVTPILITGILVLTTPMFLYYWASKINQVAIYSFHYQTRIHLMKINPGKTLYFPPLPTPSVLAAVEINSNPLHNTNLRFAKVFDFNGRLVLCQSIVDP